MNANTRDNKIAHIILLEPPVTLRPILSNGLPF
jgi:hypothetical protein